VAAGDRLVVSLGGARRSLDVAAVREVLALANLTPVPTAPPAICGVTQVRGQVIPVVDLALGLGLAPERPVGVAHTGDPVVIVDHGGLRAALAVEAAIAMAPGTAEAPPAVELGALFADLRRLAEGK